MADEGKPPFSDDQIESLKSLVSGIVNSAIRTRDQMSDKKREQDREAILKGLDEKLATLKPADDPEGKGGKGGKGANPELVALQRQLTEATDAMRANAEKAAKAEQRRRALERTSRLDGMLAKGGVSDPFMRELAIAHFNQRGVAPWSGDDDEAEVVWSVEDGVPITLDDGFGKWLKTDEAKRFLPAAGTKGSGSRPGQRPASEQKKDATYEDVGNFVLGLTRGAHIGE